MFSRPYVIWGYCFFSFWHIFMTRFKYLFFLKFYFCLYLKNSRLNWVFNNIEFVRACS